MNHFVNDYLFENWGARRAALRPYFTLFHSRIAGQETSFLENGTEVLRVILRRRAGDAMTDGASLAGHTAAGYAAHDIKFLIGIGGDQGLTNDQL